MRFSKKIRSRGHLTLPADVRDAGNIHSGDLVEFEILRILRHRDDDVALPIPGERREEEATPDQNRPGTANPVGMEDPTTRDLGPSRREASTLVKRA